MNTRYKSLAVMLPILLISSQGQRACHGQGGPTSFQSVPPASTAEELRVAKSALTLVDPNSNEHDRWQQIVWTKQFELGNQPLSVNDIQKHIDAVVARRNKAEQASPNALKTAIQKLDEDYLLIEARGLLELAKRTARFSGGAGPTPTKGKPRRQKVDDLARNKVINDRLEKILPLRFGNDTPLEEVIKYIKAELSDPKEKSTPIYVEPAGLKEAEVTLQSPIKIDLDGVPLRVTLKLALAQIKLVYKVRDGMLLITSAEIDEPTLDEMEEAKAASPNK